MIRLRYISLYQPRTLLVYCRDNLENDAEFEVEGDVPAPRPLSPEPGPSAEPEEKQANAAAGKNIIGRT